MTLSLTDCVLGRFYAVHELLRPEDEITPCHVEEMHINELPGRDIRSGGDSVGMRDPFWKDVLGEKGGKKGWEVNAGKIEHRGTFVHSLFLQLSLFTRKRRSSSNCLPLSFPSQLHP
jgi:hypothetical protein